MCKSYDEKKKAVYSKRRITWKEILELARMKGELK